MNQLNPQVLYLLFITKGEWMDQSKIFPDDIIRVILYSAYETHGNIELDFSWLHQLIYISKKISPHLFEEFVFNTSGTQPYSELLERIIMRGRISGIISPSDRLSPVPNEYVQEKLYPKFKPEDLIILKSIGRFV